MVIWRSIRPSSMSQNSFCDSPDRRRLWVRQGRERSAADECAAQGQLLFHAAREGAGFFAPWKRSICV